MPFFTHDGLRLHYLDEGAGTPFVFQHGLGMDVGQPQQLFGSLAGWRLIALDCRGHGQSELGDEARLSIPQFADDVLALVEHLKLLQFVLGGTSMGAAITLRIALGQLQQVKALVVSRPAWLDQINSPNLAILPLVAEALVISDPEAARRQFEQSPVFQTLQRESLGSAASVLSLFTRPNRNATAAVLRNLPQSRPFSSLDELTRLNVPALVVANQSDAIHPLTMAEQIAAKLPQAQLQMVTPSSESREQHNADVRRELHRFLNSLAPTS